MCLRHFPSPSVSPLAQEAARVSSLIASAKEKLSEKCKLLEAQETELRSCATELHAGAAVFSRAGVCLVRLCVCVRAHVYACGIVYRYRCLWSAL